MNEVKRIIFHELDPNRQDRRGDIVTLVCSEAPNQNAVSWKVIEVLQHLVVTLNGSYGWHAEMRGREGEQNHCWINDYSWRDEFRGIPCVVVRDKYWGPEQVAAFCSMLTALAGLHGWKVERDIDKGVEDEVG